MARPASVEKLESLLGRVWRVSIQDKRVFIGTLVCTDKEKNIILTNADEYRRGDHSDGRYVGMVMIPWRWVLKAEVEWAAYMDGEDIGGGGDSLYT
ncbi:hypothetical protein K439DRAFT_1633059 [Ramaria rubella]|nr:hypothetical protein K439DRAFT_1633059 [Ramaria rubella]